MYYWRTNISCYRLWALLTRWTNRLGKKHHVMFVGNTKCIDLAKELKPNTNDLMLELHCVTVMYVTCQLKVFMCFSCMKNTFCMFYLVCWIRFVKCQVSSIYRSLFGTSQTCWLMVDVVQMRSSDHKNLWNNPKFYHGPTIGIAKYKHVS